VVAILIVAWKREVGIKEGRTTWRKHYMTKELYLYEGRLCDYMTEGHHDGRTIWWNDYMAESLFDVRTERLT
jgi:hypothetical protein